MDYLQIANSWPVWLCAGACVAFIVVQAVAFAKLCYKNAPLVGLSKADCSKSFQCGMVTAIGPSLSCFIGAISMITVVAGSTLLAFLPESVTSAMANYILPSLFGACFASMAVKKLKIALYALPMAIILRLLGVPAWITIVCCIFGTILITYFLYKKKLIK